jgi:hypothetical protein
MIDYKDLKDLFQFLKVKSVSKKHWFNTSSWGLAKDMKVVSIEITKTTFVVAPFIVVNVDEVNMIDNTQCLSIHLYVVQKWRHIPTFDKKNSLMVKCMLDFGGLGWKN